MADDEATEGAFLQKEENETKDMGNKNRKGGRDPEILGDFGLLVFWSFGPKDQSHLVFKFDLQILMESLELI